MDRQPVGSKKWRTSKWKQLLELVWGTDFYGETRTVDIHINHVRDKIAGAQVSVDTVRGVGYKMFLKEEGGGA